MQVFIVDAFTTKMFKGNPAAVCIVEEPLSEELMLNIAAEFNLSESAFIHQSEKRGEFTIRYFSPKMEIPLCGHATLASAKVLFENYELAEINFITIEKIRLRVKERAGQIEMDFPRYKTSAAEVPKKMLVALGINKVQNCVYNQETNILCLEVSSQDLIEQLEPDFDKLIESHDSIGGVIVMSEGKGEYDYCYRHFWPWNGTNEDPVTAAVHSFMAPYWSKKLQKHKFLVYQASKRTGSMEVEMRENEGVLIRGKAVSVLKGEMIL